MKGSPNDWDRQTGVFGALLGRVAPLGWGNLGAALLDPFEQGAGVAFDLVVAAPQSRRVRPRRGASALRACTWAGRARRRGALLASARTDRLAARPTRSIEISVKNGGIARHDHIVSCSCVTRHHTRACRGILGGFPDTVRAISAGPAPGAP